MQLRPYQPADAPVLARLFYETVHTVNAKDYTPEQIDAWAPAHRDLDAWAASFLGHTAWVALVDGVVAGFGDMDPSGYLDRLYVHKDYQGQGIATALCDRLEAPITGPIRTHASRTARPFFEKRGYVLLQAQQVERQGVFLTNFVMEKRP